MPKSVLAALPASLLAAASALGHPAHAIAARAGLDPGSLADPDARIPLELHARLWESLATLGDGIGIELGAVLGANALGVVGHAMRHASTLRDAVDCLARYRAVVLDDAVPRLSFETRARTRCAVFTQTLPPRFARLRHPAECQVTATLTWLRRNSAEPIVPVELAFPHAAPADVSRHLARLGPRLRWSAGDAVLAVPAEVLDRRIPYADAAVLGYLDARASRLLGALGDGSSASFADSVRAIVGDALASGAVTMDLVADRLGASPRTLHRRLDAEGVGFAALVDDVRAQRARARLAEPGVAIGAIAYDLGYSDPAAFTRAFRRWTGQSPAAYRRTLGAP